MRFISSLVSVAALLTALSGCKTTTTTTSTQQGARYAEDLSVWRPKVAETAMPDETTPANTTGTPKPTAYVDPKLAVNKPLDAVLDSIDRINLNRGYLDGFTIQVYSGKKDEALNAKKQLAMNLPRLSSDIQFTEPIYRLKVGKYYNRLDAQQDYTDIKRYFPAAIIVPERIALN